MLRKLSLALLLSSLISPQLFGVDSGPSEADRLQKLESAVQNLQKRNAELEAEIRGLKARTTFAPLFDAEGNKRPKAGYDGKASVEKAVVEEEKAPVFVVPRGSEFKLVLGGYIQVNFEDDQRQ